MAAGQIDVGDRGARPPAQANSIDEAIAVMRRAPMGEGPELEIHQVFEAEESGDALTRDYSRGATAILQGERLDH